EPAEFLRAGSGDAEGRKDEREIAGALEEKITAAPPPVANQHFETIAELRVQLRLCSADRGSPVISGARERAVIRDAGPPWDRRAMRDGQVTIPPRERPRRAPPPTGRRRRAPSVSARTESF